MDLSPRIALQQSQPQKERAEILICEWILHDNFTPCSKIFTEATALVEHISNDHVGRKQTNNLCLDCRWKLCSYHGEKRDHIVSHIKIHVPSYRPYVCNICDKSFSRTQDLKKHTRVHAKQQSSHMIVGNNPMASMSLPTLVLQQQQQPRRMPVPLPSAGIKRTFSKSMENLIPIAPSAQNAYQQQLQLQQQQQRINDDSLLSEFMDNIQHKRLKPEYNDQMAAALTAIADQLIIPAITVNDTVMDDLSVTMPINPLPRSSDVAHMNQFLTELYQNIAADGSNELLSPTPVSNPQPMESKIDDEEIMMKYLDYEAGQQDAKLRREVAKPSADIRVETLRKAMVDLSFQHKKSGISSTRKDSDCSQSSDERYQGKETVAPKLSDPSFLLRVIKASQQPSSKLISAPSSAGNWRKLTVNTSGNNSRRISEVALPRDATTESNSAATAPHPIRRTKSQPSLRYPVSGSNRVKDRHLRVIRMMVKQLDRAWENAKL